MTTHTVKAGPYAITSPWKLPKIVVLIIAPIMLGFVMLAAGALLPLAVLFWFVPFRPLRRFIARHVNLTFTLFGKTLEISEEKA